MLKSLNVRWQDGAIDREQRWELLEQRGATVWLTGLPAAGKSTIAAALERLLVGIGRAAYVLDGDNVRHGLCGDLGFSEADRAENVRRVAHTALLLADAGTVAICALVSPYAADRALARQVHEVAGVDFLEVHVATPVTECERRDPKGLYARARAGDIDDLTGVGSPYEAPIEPELTLGRPGQTPEEAAARVLLELPAPPGR